MGWSVLRAAIPKAPRTCLEWTRSQQSALAALKELKFSVPRLPARGDNDYVRLYTCRALMLTMMAAAGVRRLKIDSSMKVQTFCHMNPDQNQYLTRMYWSFRPESVEELFDACGCAGLRPELFSMLACFCGDGALASVHFSAFSSSTVQLWRKAVLSYHSREKIYAIPAMIAKELG